jgi:hypothetical protein
MKPNNKMLSSLNYENQLLVMDAFENGEVDFSYTTRVSHEDGTNLYFPNSTVIVGDTEDKAIILTEHMGYFVYLISEDSTIDYV